MNPAVTQKLKSICAAAIGGAIGHYAFLWAARHGFYAMILPGGLIGLGASVFPIRGVSIPILCAIGAAVLSIVTEWVYAPFVADDSLVYFVGHVHQLPPLKQIMMAIGIFFAFFLPYRHRHDVGAL